LRIPADDVALFLTRVNPYVEVDGARNLNKISEELSIPYQTLRFRMQRLRDQGISIVPLIDSEKFGLSRYRANFDVTSEITDLATLFGGLHQSAGLHYYSRSLSVHSFDCEFMIPERRSGELVKLLATLEEMSLIENVKYRKLLWKEILGMKTKYYDYSNAQWDIDYSRLSGNPSDHAESTTTGSSLSSSRYDAIDLQIIKSLQIDPWMKSVDIARMLNLTDSDISYHMRHHVFGNKFIRGFRFKWIGSKESWAKHTLFPMTYRFESISEEEARHAMSIFTACPFTWNHMWTESNEYISELMVPVSHMPDTVHYLANGLRPLRLKPDSIDYPDWSCSQNYTIPYMMYSSDSGWQLECERSIGYIIQMIAEHPRS